MRQSIGTIVLTMTESCVYNIAYPFATCQLIKNDNGIRLSKDICRVLWFLFYIKSRDAHVNVDKVDKEP